MSECDRFLEALVSDRLDDLAREHARGCPVCGPLLPAERTAEAAPGPTLGTRNWSSPMAHHMALALVGAVLLVVVTLGSVLALAPGRRWSRWMLVLVPVVPALLVLSGNGVHTTVTVRSALPCLVTVVLTAVIPLAVGLALLRGMALDGARTAALALSAAATGLFAHHWHCTDGSASHLMLYHALPWLALALLAIPLRRALPTQNHVP